MNEQPRGVFGLYGQFLKEWCVSAFCAATLDWIASKIPVRNGIFATLLSIGQLTMAFMATNTLMGLFGESSGRFTYVTDGWLSYQTIILMSPTAINRLTSSYMKLHFILYGPGKIPQPPVSDCATGNCSTSTVELKSQPQRELAADMPKSQDTSMSAKIASQWKARNYSTSK
jgi:hypothetical protein